jgi:hypothetical protein
VTKSLDNKEETTYRRAKGKHRRNKRVNGYMKNILNQKDSTSTLQCPPIAASTSGRGRSPEGKQSNSHDRLEKLDLEPQILTSV